VTGSRFLNQKPGHHQIQVAAPRTAPIAARAALSKFAGALVHHTPVLSRVVAKVAAHAHLPHLHMPHIGHALLELPGQLLRKVLHRPEPPPPEESKPAAPPAPERRLKPRFNKPSGPAP